MKKKKKDSDLKENVVFNIQSIIMSVLMAITLVTIVTMGFLLYQRFKLAIDKMAVSNTEATVGKHSRQGEFGPVRYPADF